MSEGVATAALARDVEALARRARSWRGEADVFLWFLGQVADLCVRHAEASAELQAVAPCALSPLSRMIYDVGGGALRDAQAEGLVRRDLRSEDVLTVARLLSAGLDGDLASRRAASRRTRRIIVEGLRPRS
jgi:hypothetical protein